jgi:hypothetical protein
MGVTGSSPHPDGDGEQSALTMRAADVHEPTNGWLQDFGIPDASCAGTSLNSKQCSIVWPQRI